MVRGAAVEEVVGETEMIDEEQGSPGQDLAPETETTLETGEDAETSLLHTRERDSQRQECLYARDMKCNLSAVQSCAFIVCLPKLFSTRNLPIMDIRLQ